eukprot:1327945-Amorphochlora_amoeboformis.AAC.1
MEDIDDIDEDEEMDDIDEVIRESKESKFDAQFLPSTDIQPLNYDENAHSSSRSTLPPLFENKYSRSSDWQGRWQYFGEPITIGTDEVKTLQGNINDDILRSHPDLKTDAESSGKNDIKKKASKKEESPADQKDEPPVDQKEAESKAPMETEKINDIAASDTKSSDTKSSNVGVNDVKACDISSGSNPTAERKVMDLELPTVTNEAKIAPVLTSEPSPPAAPTPTPVAMEKANNNNGAYCIRAHTHTHTS